MSLQSRLSDLITAVGADIKLLSSRMPTEDRIQVGVVGVNDLAQYQANGANTMFIEAGTIWARLNGVLRRFTVPRTTVSGFTNTATSGQLRLDQVIFDPNDGTVKRVAGTAQSNVTIDARQGAGLLPTDGVVLWDLVVTSTGISTAAGNMRSRRPWARGAFSMLSIQSGDQTMTNGSPITFAGAAAIIGASLRMECSGAPLTLSLRGQKSQTTSDYIVFYPVIDGVQIQSMFGPNTETGTKSFNYEIVYIPSPGSHLFTWRAQAAAGVNVVYKNAGSPLQMIIKEDLTQNANNGVA